MTDDSFLLQVGKVGSELTKQIEQEFARRDNDKGK